MSTPRERPIPLFAPEVRAILDDRKTQTRRVVKGVFPSDGHDCVKDGDGLPSRLDYAPPDWEVCPHGVPGDRLWVRERFYVAERYSYGTDPSGEPIELRGVPRGPVYYHADGLPENTPNSHYPAGLRGGMFAAPDPYAIWRPRPSSFMPRWASRITFEITGVRVERLQGIGTKDAFAEGIEIAPSACDHAYECSSPSWPGVGAMSDELSRAFGGRPYRECRCVCGAFGVTWDQLNGKTYPWSSNPWVWALTFRRLP